MFFLKLKCEDRAPRALRRYASLSFTAIFAFACATPAAAAGADDAYPIMRTKNSEDEMVAALGKIKKAATDAEYVSAIRGAKCLMSEGSYAAARQLLGTVPPEQRAWEWGYLAEQCGAPPWKVNLPLDPNAKLHPSAKISSQLLPIVEELPAEAGRDYVQEETSITSPDGNFQVVFDPSTGRHGAYLALLQSPPGGTEDENPQNMDPEALGTSSDPRVVFSLWTGNYGGRIGTVRFSPDGSCLVVKAPANSIISGSTAADTNKETRTNSRSPEKQADAANDDGENWAVFFVPLPLHVSDKRPQASEDDTPTVIRTPWQERRISELPTGTQDAIKKIENFDASSGGLSARFADYYANQDGKLMGLFNCFESSAAAEVRELPSGKVVATLGKRCNFDAEKEQNSRPDINALLGEIDIGGAFSPDGSRVIVSPCALEDSKTQDEESAKFGSVVAFRVADGTGTTLQIPPSTDDHAGRTLCPVWGWSPDSRYAFSSIFDGASIVNTVGVCDAATGQKVEAVPGDLRYVAWSPDASRVYMMKHNSGSMLVADPETFETVATIPEATNPSGYPAFLDFPVYASPDRTRFTVGRLVFASEDPDNPLVRLSAAPARAPLTSWLLESLRNKSTPTKPTIGNEALLNWAQEAGKH